DSQIKQFQTYETKLMHLITYFRETLHKRQLTFVMGLLGEFLGQDGFGVSATEYQEINEIITSVANNNPQCYYDIEEGLTSNQNVIHIDGYSQRLFGLRYYEAFSKRGNIQHPLANVAEKESYLYKNEFTQNEKIYMLVARLSQNKITYQDFLKEM